MLPDFLGAMLAREQRKRTVLGASWPVKKLSKSSRLEMLAWAHDSSRDSKKRLDSGYILWVETRGLTNGLDMEIKEKEESGMIPQQLEG